MHYQEVPLGILFAAFIIAATPVSSLAQSAAAGNIDIESISPVNISGDLTYSGHFLCGTISPDPDLQQFPAESSEELLAPGTYLTILNIHNPHPRNQQLELTVARNTSLSSFFLSIIDHEVIEFNCLSFLDFLGIEDTDKERRERLKRDFFRGVIAIRVERELQVMQINSLQHVVTPTVPSEIRSLFQNLLDRNSVQSLPAN